MKAFLWGMCLLAILATLQLRPKADVPWLVVFAPSGEAHNALRRTQHTSSSIVEIIDNDTLVLSPEANTSPADFYEVGALLVINASAAYGCSNSPRNQWAKQKQTGNRYGNDI